MLQAVLHRHAVSVRNRNTPTVFRPKPIRTKVQYKESTTHVQEKSPPTEGILFCLCLLFDYKHDAPPSPSPSHSPSPSLVDFSPALNTQMPKWKNMKIIKWYWYCLFWGWKWLFVDLDGLWERGVVYWPSHPKEQKPKKRRGYSRNFLLEDVENFR